MFVINSGNFSVINNSTISRNPLSFLSSSGVPVMHLLYLFKLPHSSWLFCFFKFIFYFFSILFSLFIFICKFSMHLYAFVKTQWMYTQDVGITLYVNFIPKTKIHNKYWNLVNNRHIRVFKGKWIYFCYLSILHLKISMNWWIDRITGRERDAAK